MPAIPLKGSYAATLAVVLLALSPDIVVTTSYHFLVPGLTGDLGTGKTTLRVAEGLSNAGYALGAILGGDLTQRFRQRHLVLSAETAFVLGSVLAAAAPGAWTFSAGRILQGLATGLLLVSTLPPLVRQFPPGRMPLTAAAVNVGFFGAVTAGPLIGGAVATGSVWRWYFAGLAGLGALALVLAWLSLPVTDPPAPERPVDVPALVLAALGTGLAFYGVARLGSVGFASPLFYGPLAGGLLSLVALLLVEQRRAEPLVPVQALKSNVPLAGTVVAMAGGAAFVTFLLLGEMYLQDVAQWSPLHTGLAYWPQVVALVAASVAYWRLFLTRWVPHYILAGMVLLLVGGLPLVLVGPSGGAFAVAAASAALGAGAGMTVSPALWLAGLAMAPALLGRIFALVELVRSEADFLVGPVLEHVARTHGSGGAALAGGVREAAFVTLLLTLAGTVGAAWLYLADGKRPERPDVQQWLQDGELAVSSPGRGSNAA